MPSQIIQWFPGHMAKTRRMISENLKNVDFVIELRDARIPKSSENPEIGKLIGAKPRMILLNKAGLADPSISAVWAKASGNGTTACILTDCKTGAGLDIIPREMSRICRDKIDKYEERGMSGRRLKAMVVGIPNVGKSTLINRLSDSKKAKVEDRPGVTRDKQWVQTPLGMDLLDMPGVLWPKFDDKTAGENLALTGAIKDDVLDTAELALILIRRLRALYPALLGARYKTDHTNDFGSASDLELFELIGKKRGFLLRGGEIDYDRTASVLLDEFREGKIGHVTLDRR